MKKQLTAALVLVAAAIGAAAPSWAFQSVQRATVTAGTTVGGVKAARFTLNVRSINNQTANLTVGSSITWSSVVAGDGWKMADRLLVINSTVTDLNGGIQLYTENTANDASPKFTDPTPGVTTNPDSAAAGLVSAVDTTVTLPLAWSIKSSSKVVEGTDPLTSIGATDPNNGSASGANNKFQWLFVTDRYNSSGIDYNQDGDVTDAGDAAPFVDGSVYQSIVRVNGIHTGQGDTDIEVRPDGTNAFVYFESNFANALPQTSYQTTALRVEAFIQ